MMKNKLFAYGLAVVMAGMLQLGLSGPGQASPLAAQGTIGAGKSITQSDDVDQVVQFRRRGGGGIRRSGRINRRAGIRRSGRINRRAGVRRSGRINRRAGVRRGGHINRYRGHSRHSHRFRRHSRHSFGIGFGYPYNGYGYPYYGDGYGYPYYPAVVVADTPYSTGYRRSNRRSCGIYGVGSRKWSRCCSRKYRSFNRHTGRYLAYSGRYRRCR